MMPRWGVRFAVRGRFAHGATSCAHRPFLISRQDTNLWSALHSIPWLKGFQAARETDPSHRFLQSEMPCFQWFEPASHRSRLDLGAKMAKQPCIETLSIGMHASKNPAAAKKCWENEK